MAIRFMQSLSASRRHFKILMRMLPYLLFFVQRATSMALLPSKSPQTIQNINDIISSPHIGYVKDPSNKVEVFVIGTSHVKCSSAVEVTQLITNVHPDGVVLELDPERVLRLTKQYYGFDADGNLQFQKVAASEQTIPISNSSKGGKELLYGSDFIAAVTTCQEMDIPLFLGDEYAKETQQRLMNQLFRVEAYSPIPLVTSLLPDITSKARADIATTTTTSRISLMNTFRMDPKKLTPLAVSSSPPLMLAALALLVQNNEAAASIAYSSSSSGILKEVLNVLETSISIVISFFASCFLFNTVIVERDEILADSTIRARDVLRSLKNGTFIRKRWEFSVNSSMNPNEKKTTSRGTLASIVELKEGKRPISGDRKIGVTIEGVDEFTIDDESSSISVTNDGYMIAKKWDSNDLSKPIQIDDEYVKVVVVVGLLHGNGVVKLLST
eukprot:scaffold11066_cov151-Skeletonema_menzelii.AAC.2